LELEKVIKDLIDNKWELEIRYTDNEYSFVVWKPEWVTNDLYAARVCPIGKGKTWQQAYHNLRGQITGTEKWTK